MVDETVLRRIENDWRKEFPLRLAAIIATTGLTWLYVGGIFPAILGAANFGFEIFQFILFGIKRYLKPRILWILTIGIHFFGGFAFSFFAILFFLLDKPYAQFLGMLVLFGLVRNVAVSRSSVLLLAQVTLIGPMSIFLVLPAIAVGADGTTFDLVFFYVATTVFLGYMAYSLYSWHRIYEERDAALSKMEQANEAKDLFLASVSHDLRTPLNGINGIAELLSSDPDGAQTPSRIDILQKSTRALRRLADDILDFARMETGRFDLSYELADIKAETHSVISFYRPAAQRAGIAIAWPEIPATPIMGMFDPVRFRQCLSNLIDNAIKYSEKGPITVKVELAKDFSGSGLAKVSVTDQGIGISKENLPKVFDDFFHTSEAPGVGHSVTGLGLAIVKRLSEAMGGSASVQSKLGEGSRFSFSFAFEEIKDTGSKRSVETSTKPSFQDVVALVVDDVATNTYIAGSFLETKGVTVLMADSGALALDILSKYNVDVVLLDIEMPEMNGESVFQEIQKHPEVYGNVPVIAVTANAMAEHRKHYISMGMQGYISKPLEIDRLFSVIAQVLNVPRDLPSPKKPAPPKDWIGRETLH